MSVTRYSIPPDNPFAGVPGKRGEIWVMGLRNPHRFSFDRQTGDLYISDVGQVRFEEIDFKPAGSSGGQNYGWPYLEGNHCYATPNCNPQPYVAPITEYSARRPTMRCDSRYSLSRSGQPADARRFLLRRLLHRPPVGLKARRMASGRHRPCCWILTI